MSENANLIGPQSTFAQIHSSPAARNAQANSEAEVAKLVAPKYAVIDNFESVLVTVDGLEVTEPGTWDLEFWATSERVTQPRIFTTTDRLIFRRTLGDYAPGQTINNVWSFGKLIGFAPKGSFGTIVIVRTDAKGVVSQVAAYSPNESRLAENLFDTRKFVFEFYAASLDHYFITANLDEAIGLASNPSLGWRPTGFVQEHLDAAVRYFYSPSPLYRGVCRFYGHPTIGPNSHFYTAGDGECAGLRALQKSTPDTQPRWNFEEYAFTTYGNALACPPTHSQVYRVYNNRAAKNDSNHRYVFSTSEYTKMQQQGWQPEGAVMCAVKAFEFSVTGHR